MEEPIIIDLKPFGGEGYVEMMEPTLRARRERDNMIADLVFTTDKDGNIIKKTSNNIDAVYVRVLSYDFCENSRWRKRAAEQRARHRQEGEWNSSLHARTEAFRCDGNQCRVGRSRVFLGFDQRHGLDGGKQRDLGG